MLPAESNAIATGMLKAVDDDPAVPLDWPATVIPLVAPLAHF